MMILLTIGLGVTIAVAAYVAVKFHQYQSTVADFEKQKEELIKTINVHEESYMSEECDNLMIDECRRYFQQTMPKGIQEEMESITDFETRKKRIQEIARDMARIMKLEGTKIEFEDYPLCVQGQYKYDEDVVSLNESLVLCSPKSLINTIIHEFKHRVQFLSLQNDVWHYSTQRKAEWLYCFENYSNANVCYEAYYGQVVEVDARMFANTITD